MSVTKTLYNCSPVWVQNVMVSLRGLANNYKRWDTRLGRQLLSGLMESQWWSSEQFTDYTNRMLRKHIHLAAHNVPYYRDLFREQGIDPDSIRTVEDLTKIPLLEKSQVREAPTKFLRGGKPRKAWNQFFTSGTTGTPMHLYMSRESFTRTWSFVFRLRSWAGVSDPVYPRRVQFTGRDIVPDKRISSNGVYWRLNHPGNALLMSTSHLSQYGVPSYIQAMYKFEPELIEGYPSAIMIIARVAKSLELKLPQPKAVITSAETLYDHDRMDIQDAFNSKVFNQYASSDTGAFICDCDHGQLHINPEFGVCEILNSNGKPAQPGEQGEIVTTSFCNREQVLIRYRIGDIAVVGPDETCACGRHMPRIESVSGRIDDILYIPDRGFIGRFDPVFKGLVGIYEAQIVQESLDELKVKLVPDASFDDRVKSHLLSNLRAKVGDTVRIDIEKVHQIPRGPNGKFRTVVSQCRDAYPEIIKSSSSVPLAQDKKGD